jgi:hypothetical protein
MRYKISLPCSGNVFRLMQQSLVFGLLFFCLPGMALAQTLMDAPRQTTNTVFMVSPDYFGFNVQTSESNVFQNLLENLGRDAQSLRDDALSEFASMTADLQAAGIEVIHVPSRQGVETPDAVFPNNWFSVHQTANGGRYLVLYPMLASNRRLERQPATLIEAMRARGMSVDKVIDLTAYEAEDKFLEGTGSMILDREHGVAFAALSPRTHLDVLQDFASQTGYRPVVFYSVDPAGTAVYHTNVIMSVGAKFAVLCVDSIADKDEQARVLKELHDLGKTVIDIRFDQVLKMCGNILELQDKEGRSVIVMSRTAFDHFTAEQKSTLTEFGTLLPVDIPVIEAVGGGSARCMLGEVF